MPVRALMAATLLITLPALALLVSGRAWAQAGSFHIVSDETAKYAYTEEADWETLGFDDSAWSFVVAPSTGLCGEPDPGPPGAPEPIWGEDPQEFQTIFVRKTFTLGAAATAHIIMAVDDDYDLYINGELIGGNHDGVAGSDRYTNVPLRAGVNVLAVMAVDVAGGCQALSFDIFPPPEPPANDDVADAVVIPALDFTDARDTRGATTDPDDPSSCSEGGPNVWYTFTPREDMVVRLSTAGSSYDVFLDVFASTAEGLITCAWGELTFDASAGTTYYVMVSSPSSFGGDLVFAALDLGAPLQVTLSLNATGSFNPKTGDATIRGTVTCNQPAGVDMWGGVRQKLGRTIIQADFYLFVDCEGSTPWSATVRSNQGAFGGGPVEVSASASGCSPIGCGEDQVTATVKLSGKQ